MKYDDNANIANRVLNNLPSSITSIANETKVFKKTLEMVSYG